MNNIISEETFTEYKYAIRHKPTQKWVWFGNDEMEVTVSCIILVDFKDCLVSDSKGYLEMFLRTSAFPHFELREPEEIIMSNIFFKGLVK